jgi:hypothetical protein
MIAVIDTNIFISGLLSRVGYPAIIRTAWLLHDFELATCEDQIREFRETSRKDKLCKKLSAGDIGRTINAMRRSKIVRDIPRRHKALDPTDSYLLDLATATSADYLVTGDKKSGLLQLGKLDGTRILSPAEFCTEVLKLDLSS